MQNEHSYKYRPLDNYLIDRDRWQRAKQQLIERAGLARGLRRSPEDAQGTGRGPLPAISPHRPQHCGGEESPHQVQEEGRLHSLDAQAGRSDAEPLQQYFPDHRIVPLVEVLATVNRFTHYVDELQHPQQRYHHGNPLGSRDNSYTPPATARNSRCALTPSMPTDPRTPPLTGLRLVATMVSG